MRDLTKSDTFRYIAPRYVNMVPAPTASLFPEPVRMLLECLLEITIFKNGSHHLIYHPVRPLFKLLRIRAG